MSDRAFIRILHLSDIHFTSAKSAAHDQNHVLKRFHEDLKDVVATHLRPDIIIVSGDVCSDGESIDTYYAMLEHIFDELLPAIGVDQNYMFLLPGNHDARHSSITPSHIEPSFSELTNRQALNSFYFSNPGNLQLSSKFSSFNELQRFAESKFLLHSDSYCRTYYVPGLDLGIVILNTAWLTHGGIDKISDYQKLLFPEAALTEAFSKLPKTANVVAAGHHPLTWLHPTTQETIRAALAQKAFIYLHGHLHDARPAHIKDAHGTLFLAQAGALYQKLGRYAGYSIISFDTGNHHIELQGRSYFAAPRDKFDKATDVFEHGRFYSTDAAETFWAHQPKKVAPLDLSTWIRDALTPDCINQLNEGLADRPLSELFVPPPIVKVPDFTDKDADEVEGKTFEEEVKYASLLDSPDNFHIFGRQDYGKTTLLKNIALDILRKEGREAKHGVPVFIDFNELNDTADAPMRALRKSLPDLSGLGCTLDDLLRGGQLTILIDNLSAATSRKQKHLLAFISQYPTNRFICSSTSNPFDDFKASPTLPAAVPFAKCFLRPFRRADMRSLVEKWRKVPDDKERVLNNLISDMRYLNVPPTGVAGTIILTIVDSKRDITLTNRAVMIESYIDVMLDKHSTEGARRSKFDFSLKVDLLAYIAKHMVMGAKYRLTYAELLEVTSVYMNYLGLNEPVKLQIDNFVASKIFRVDDDIISFKYRAFLEFFIASRMVTDLEFRSYILDESRYLSFPSEIDFYSAKARRDGDLLDLIGKRFASLEADIKQHFDWDRDPKTFEKLKSPHPDQKAQMFVEVERQINAPPLTDAERDELLEAEFPADLGDHQDVYRPSPKDLGERWTYCLLVYSGVLRNSELVSDTRKREHLTAVLRGWASFTYHSLLMVPNLVKHRRLIINGVPYHVNMPKDMTDAEVGHALYLGMPRAVQEVMATTLASEKLERQLSEPTLFEGKEALVLRLYRGGLLATLMPDKAVKIWEELESALRDSEYLYEAFLWHLQYLLPRRALELKDDKLTRQLMAKIMATLAPVAGDERKKLRGANVQKLERSKLLNQLRIEREKKDK